MTYSLILRSGLYDNEYINGLKSWKEVTDYLKTKLKPCVLSVTIYKYSSDNRTLGKLYVTMSNLLKVASSENDKIMV